MILYMYLPWCVIMLQVITVADYLSTLTPNTSSVPLSMEELNQVIHISVMLSPFHNLHLFLFLNPFDFNCHVSG